MPIRPEIEQALSESLARHLEGTPDNLAESIRYSLLSAGKRIRPRLLFECAKMIGLAQEAAVPAAVALEMVHCFTLIHDDLPCMDDDDIRRGQPSNHKKFGEAIALLAGDSLMALAVEAFMDVEPLVPRPAFNAALRRLCWAMGPKGVIGGQAAESRLAGNSSLEDLRAMHAMKTGALFSAALLIPKDLAGIDNDSSEGLSIHSFAQELGLAFQVADDFDDSSTEEADPTNILFFLSREGARSMTLQRLTSAAKSLASTWGPKAHPLTLIADEVTRRLGGSP